MYHSCVIKYASRHCGQASAILSQHKLGHPLDTPGLQTLVYKEGSAVKGVCIFGVADGYVYRLAVGKAYQRQGVGRALLHRAMFVLHDDYGVEEMSLNYQTDEARGYYANLGWVVDEASSCCRLKLT